MSEDACEPDFATLAIVYRQPEAAVLASMLRAYGIVARATNGFAVTLYPHYSVLLGGISILVSSNDLEASAALVGDPGALPHPPRPFRCGHGCNVVVWRAVWDCDIRRRVFRSFANPTHRKPHAQHVGERRLASSEDASFVRRRGGRPDPAPGGETPEPEAS